MGQIREKKRYLKNIEVRDFVKFVLKIQEREKRPRKFFTWLLRRFKR